MNPVRPLSHYKPTRVLTSEPYVNPDELVKPNDSEVFFSKYKFIDAWAWDQQRRHETDVRLRNIPVVKKISNITYVPSRHKEAFEKLRSMKEKREKLRLEADKNSREIPPSEDSDFEEKERIFLYETRLGVKVYGEVP